MLLAAWLVMAIPPALLGTPAVPAASVPMKFLDTSLLFVFKLSIRTPWTPAPDPLPEMTLPTPRAPPMMLPAEPVSRSTPWESLPRSSVPDTSVPIQLPWTVLLPLPLIATP